MHKCSRCKLDKNVDQFQLYKNRPNGQCRSCKTECERKRRIKIGIEPKVFSKIKNNTKLCMLCKIFKRFLEFSPSKRGLADLSSYCKKCTLIKYKDTKKNTESVQRYRKNNRPKYLAQHRLHQFFRKTKIKIQTDNSVTNDFLKSIYECEFCYYCNNKTDMSKRTLEHLIPLSKGGLHSTNNIVMACKKCNFSKSDKTESEYRKAIHVHKS